MNFHEICQGRFEGRKLAFRCPDLIKKCGLVAHASSSSTAETEPHLCQEHKVKPNQNILKCRCNKATPEDLKCSDNVCQQALDYGSLLWTHPSTGVKAIETTPGQEEVPRGSQIFPETRSKAGTPQPPFVSAGIARSAVPPRPPGMPPMTPPVTSSGQTRSSTPANPSSNSEEFAWMILPMFDQYQYKHYSRVCARILRHMPDIRDSGNCDVVYFRTVVA